MKKTLCILVTSLMIVLLNAQSWELSPENIARTLERESRKVMKDTLRPAYHLTPPAGSMGDPNGGVYLDGWYHMFYGLQPFSAAPGAWYWAHVKSQDLLHWEHMKPGLTPPLEMGVSNVGSGSTFIDQKGDAWGFFSAHTNENDSMQFWMAEFSKDLTEWTYDKEDNPVLTLKHPGLPRFDAFWRDPYVFETKGRVFMIACADLLDEDYVPVPIFEAKNNKLTSWEYKGILFTYPKHEFRNFEVPELKRIGDTWIFMASCDAPTDRTLYFTGDFDPEILRFIPHSSGIIDYSGHYYASETIQDDKGDLFQMAWIPGWDRPWMPNYRDMDKKNVSPVWNGCFSLPRRLMLNEKGDLIQQPVSSLKQLRAQHFSIGPMELPVYGPVAEFTVLEDIRGDQLEVKLDLDLQSASLCGLNVLCDNEGKGGMYIMWSGHVINVDGIEVPIEEWKRGQSLHLHVFIDKQVVEVFINEGKYCVTRLLKKEFIKGDHVALSRLGGHARLLSLDAWTLKNINQP